jgi:serine/threonine-protein kinase
MGAMGEVWRADHVSLGTTVAVKLIDTADRDDAAELLARFHQEARAAAQLKSPHVVQILDHGADGRVAFMAMELLEGESLERRIERRGRLTPSEVAHVVRELARGLDRAHAAGIVHRDLKPPNVFIARVDGAEVVKVLDFGIAKMLGTPRDAQLQTQHGFVVGTPAYMSPEQVLGRHVDHQSDLWQVAIIAFECITGKRPFDGETLGQLFMAVCNLPMPVPSACAEVPAGFDAWFARAADREPTRRFASAGEMAQALGGILAPGGVGESAIPTLTTSASKTEIVLPSPTGRSEAWSTARPQDSEPARRATPLTLLAGLLLAPLAVLVVGGGVWLFNRARVQSVAIAITAPAASPSPQDPEPVSPVAMIPEIPSASASAALPVTKPPVMMGDSPKPPATRRPGPRSTGRAPPPGPGSKPPIDLGI